MSVWIRIVVAAAILFAAMYALSAFIGALFWIGGVVLLVAVIGAIVSSLVGVPRLQAPSKRVEKRIDRDADRALKEMEQRTLQK